LPDVSNSIENAQVRFANLKTMRSAPENERARRRTCGAGSMIFAMMAVCR
jgi:hypothetical protein